MTHSQDWQAADQCDSQSEGLASKLEDINPRSSGRGSYKRKAEDVGMDTSEADSEEDEESTQIQGESGRRVRARSLIDDEQLAVLKGYYAINPRPKKEEIAMIANYINFPTRVVQVPKDSDFMYTMKNSPMAKILLTFFYSFSCCKIDNFEKSTVIFASFHL